MTRDERKEVNEHLRRLTLNTCGNEIALPIYNQLILAGTVFGVADGGEPFLTSHEARTAEALVVAVIEAGDHK